MKSLSEEIVAYLQQEADEQYNIQVKEFIEYRIAKINDMIANAEFESVARDMIKFLNRDYIHPHHTVVITGTNAELLEGKISTGLVEDYLKD